MQGGVKRIAHNATSDFNIQRSRLTFCCTGQHVYGKSITHSLHTRLLSNKQGSAGFLADWKTGEEMRRPPSLTVDASSDLDETSTETAEQRWRRERDDWLFGRSASYVRVVTFWGVRSNASEGGFFPYFKYQA